MNSREKDKIKKFYHDIIGIKSETVLQTLAENSRIRKLNTKTLLIKENEKVEQISFLYKMGGILKAYYKNQKGKNQIHCFAHLPGEPLVGIINLDRNMTSFLTVEAVTDCEIISTSASVIQKLSRESIEVALTCNRMQGISALREYEHRKVILTCTPAQRYEYFLEAYPEIMDYLNKKDVASYLNMTPECFSRMLKNTAAK
ncbi:Crp/Fnr family transcriptional regulator [Blautia sp. HCP3S3_D9]|uniref:Crp/Fnr family transcriptional regulator n=1 Tax=Blautia sp. HCP3S3_D9 TaxID=3438912 RepID=UPI003F8A23B0